MKRFPFKIPRHFKWCMWCESEDGRRKAPIDLRGKRPWPSVKEYPIAVNVESRTLRIGHYLRRKDGGYGGKDLIGYGTRTFPESLVVALLIGQNRMPHFSLVDAIRIAACACERCMNILAHAYGLNWGYAKNSPQARCCNTCCDLCRNERKLKPYKLCPDPPSLTNSQICPSPASGNSSCASPAT